MDEDVRVFFDLDGTLTDPKEGITASICYAQQAVGCDVSAADDLTWCIGPPLLESLEQLVGSALAPQALIAYRERFAEVGWRENRPYDGIHEALRRCRLMGASLYVATSKPWVYAERILEHFDLAQYIQQVFGAELDGTRSDKAELLRYALNLTGTEGTSVMVGDRRHDVAGALANDVLPIGVRYGYGSQQELTDAGARCVVEQVEELPDAIASLTCLTAAW